MRASAHTEDDGGAENAENDDENDETDQQADEPEEDAVEDKSSAADNEGAGREIEGLVKKQGRINTVQHNTQTTTKYCK